MKVKVWILYIGFVMTEMEYFSREFHKARYMIEDMYGALSNRDYETVVNIIGKIENIDPDALTPREKELLNDYIKGYMKNLYPDAANLDDKKLIGLGNEIFDVLEISQIPQYMTKLAEYEDKYRVKIENENQVYDLLRRSIDVIEAFKQGENLDQVIKTSLKHYIPNPASPARLLAKFKNLFK